MVELFEQDIKTLDRQSSKGNQLKWNNNDIWYKADYVGYEGLVEYTISSLLELSNLNENEFVKYTPLLIKYKNNVYNGVSSKNFLKSGYQLITLERLFKNYFNKSLHTSIWTIHDVKERIKFLVDEIERITKLKGFGKYINKVLTIDMFFLNEDRHTHNIAVLMNENGEFNYCPIFDNGAGLLSDTLIDHPMGCELYKSIKSVKSKTFSLNFEEQVNESEILYGSNVIFKFTINDVERILSLDGTSGPSEIYPIEIRKRVRDIIFEQMRKYKYLF